jgi:hypothetical protein
MDELMSIDEAARRLGGISPWTIRSWISKGTRCGIKIPKTKVGGRTMIRESELARVIRDEGDEGVLVRESHAGCQPQRP